MPFGLYDLGKIVQPPISLRLGVAGEGYDGIRKDRVNVEGRLTLVDATGPFGNPTSDSARTMTTPATTDVLVLLYVPATLPRVNGERALAPDARSASPSLPAASKRRRISPATRRPRFRNFELPDFMISLRGRQCNVGLMYLSIRMERRFVIVDVVVAAGGKGRRLGGAIAKQWLIARRSHHLRAQHRCVRCIAAHPRHRRRRTRRGPRAARRPRDACGRREVAGSRAWRRAAAGFGGRRRRRAAGRRGRRARARCGATVRDRRDHRAGRRGGRARRRGDRGRQCPRHGEAHRASGRVALDRRHDPARRCGARADTARIPSRCARCPGAGDDVVGRRDR